MRERKLEYMAWLVFEVSKNWFEADADISETIDFCEYLRARGAALCQRPNRRCNCRESATR